MRIICRTEDSKNVVRGKLDKMPLPAGPDDFIYQVEIKKWKPNRSIAQNSLFHAIVREMARELGHSPSDMKDMVKIKLRPEWNAQHEIDGFKYTRLFSTSDLTVIAFSELFDDLIRWIGQLGIGVRIDPSIADEAGVRY